MSIEKFYVPLVKKEGEKDDPFVLVSVHHSKYNRAVNLSIRKVAVEIRECDGVTWRGEKMNLMSGHVVRVAEMPRLNRRKLELLLIDARREVESKTGMAWSKVVEVAKQEGYEMAGGPTCLE